MVGGPAWLGTDRFDVIAKAPADATPEAQRDMLRNLLTDRFKLKVHDDTRPATPDVCAHGEERRSANAR